MMIKEILALMLLLHFCNCKLVGGGKNNDSCADGGDVIKHHNWKCGERCLYSKICISSDHEDENVKNHPGKSLKPISQTDIKAVMADVEIIRINEHGLIIGLELEVEWFDNRLKILKIWHKHEKKIWHKYEKLADEPFKLHKREFHQVEDLFWVPYLKYGKGNVLDHEKLTEMSLCYKNGTLVSQKFHLTTAMKCKMDFIHFPFDHHLCKLKFRDRHNETNVESINITDPRMSDADDTNNYVIKAIEKYSLKNPTKFGIKISFERTTKATHGILINYHLMCAIIIMVSAINFLVDPKLVPGRAGLLVTLFLVLTNFFGKAQDEVKGFTALTVYILSCMTFIATAMLYYGLLLFKLRKILKIKDQKMVSSDGNEVQTSNSVIKLDRLMLVFYVLMFIIFNGYYFMKYLL